jgi:DNA-binding NtrC family response regulator
MEQPQPMQSLPQASRNRILIVDDDTNILDVFPHLLRPGRYSIAVASRGSLAVELACHRTFDLAFVDYFMDDMNGVEVSQKLRQVQPHIQVVLMSGHSFDDLPDIMAKSGACEFLQKPLNADELQSLTDRLLAEENAPRAKLD